MQGGLKARPVAYRHCPDFTFIFMQILYLLIPISVILIIAAVCAFYWTVRHRQFDDLESPGMIPLLDDTEEERQRGERDT